MILTQIEIKRAGYNEDNINCLSQQMRSTRDQERDKFLTLEYSRNFLFWQVLSLDRVLAFLIPTFPSVRLCHIIAFLPEVRTFSYRHELGS
jgi:hypothetical protein